MTFEEVLNEAIAMLKRQGRVSYRALKRQFDLDEDYLDDLKEALVFSYPQVRDEAGRGLIWTGESAAAPEPASSPSSPDTRDVQTSPPGPIPAEFASPDAERRQLTVMFCDLVGSTSLSGELDPEDFREVVRAYQAACTDVIQRYDGHVAQLLGDGLLVYFGYPQAHEDDAQRAVRTGLGILEALSVLNTQLELSKDIKLAVRLGVHTGLVVIGDMGGEGRREQLALGETPNVAARIQSIADPDTVVMSADTHRLVRGYFECESLGEHELRGVSHPIGVYRVLGDPGIQSRLDVARARGLTPLVGRQSELHLLLDRWYQATSGEGQVVLLNAEPGLGKSRMVQAIREHLVGEAYTRLECRSSPYYQNSALYPVIDLMQRTLRWQQDDSADEKLGKLEQMLSQYRLDLSETVSLLAALLSLSVPEDKYPPLNLTPQRQRQKTLETIVAMVLELAEREPVFLIVEDLHWTDPSTLELLGLLVDQTPAVSIYTLLTCRPEFQVQWTNRSYFTQVTLNRLSREDIAQMATQVTGGKSLPSEVLQQLIEKTDGVPLYVEEMTKAALESGVLKEVDGQYKLTGSISTLSIPATLQDSLMARLDRLVTAKAVAQYAAVIGRQFSYELLQSVLQLDETLLQRELGRLVEAEIVYPQGMSPQATYTFKHALIRDAAYESLLKSTRQSYHGQIAQILEERFPEVADTQPELLGYHYTEVGFLEQAVGYWYKAGQKAIERSANVEAISHLRNGLDLLQGLPDTSEHIYQELGILTTLGPALMATKGFAAPDVRQVYARARELCQQAGDTPQLFPVLWGLWGSYSMGGEWQTARELGEQCLSLAQRAQDAALLLQADHALGVTCCMLGDLASARVHLERGIDLYDARQHRAQASLYGGHDPGVCCLLHAAWTLWSMGYPSQALARGHEAISLAQDLDHPMTLTHALAYMAILYQFRREAPAVKEQAEGVIALATEHGFTGYGTRWMILRGWSLIQQGQREEGMTQMRQGLGAAPSVLSRVYQLPLMAEAYGIAGQPEKGLGLLAEAMAAMSESGQSFFAAEVYRLKGELLLRQLISDAYQAETCFHQALSIARHQQAKSLELRAATSLARLWKQQGKRDEARQLLGDVYGWFTEGFDTANLMDAKALLDALEDGR